MLKNLMNISKAKCYNQCVTYVNIKLEFLAMQQIQGWLSIDLKWVPLQVGANFGHKLKNYSVHATEVKSLHAKDA